MTVFAVIPDKNYNIEPLEKAIASKYGDNSRHHGEAWYISAQATTKDISDALGISDKSTGPAVVVAIAGYFGRAPSDFWEWMSSKFEQK